MNNVERRLKVAQLREQLAPLSNDLLMKKLRLNFLFGRNRYNKSEQDEKEINIIEKEIAEIVKKIEPITKELNPLTIKYKVEYNGIVYENGKDLEQNHEKYICLATDVDIDTKNKGWQEYDLNNEDIISVIDEISKNIYGEYLSFTIKNIVKM